jgi:hypothetical protein
MLQKIMLAPDKVASILRRIATKIDASKQPSSTQVRQDLRLLSSVLCRQHRVARIAREMLQIAADDVELSMWDTDEGKDLEEAMKFVRKTEEPDKLVPALKSLKHDVDGFITELRREPGTKKPEETDDEDVVTSAPPRREIKQFAV